MTKHFFYRDIFLTILLFASFSGTAQSKTTVKVSVDKNKILIGERFSLMVETTIPVKETIPYWSIDNVPHFEIIAKEKIDTTKSENTITIIQRIQLTSFDSGHWYIPSFNFGKRIRTDSIAVDVVFSDFDPQKPYHDIKEIIEVNTEEKKQWWL